MQLEFFATTAKGVEAVLADELRALGAGEVLEETGGARFSGDLETLYRANLWLRTANRVLLPLHTFDCGSELELYAGVREIDWSNHLRSTMTLAVDANVRDSAITHSKYAALKSKDAVVDQMRERFGARPSVDRTNPDLRINVHIVRDRCTVSLDSSGESLHKRGYRVAKVEAPLKETLAAAIVILTGWDGKRPLVDPMCGSGTIPIEAALIASDVPPGLPSKSFGFQRWLDYDERVWRSLLEEARARRKTKRNPIIFACDISRKAIRAAEANAKAAGADGAINFKVSDAMEFDPPAGPGTVVLNPPYGERLGKKRELEALYKRIGDLFKREYTGYTGYVFTGNLDLAKRIGLRASRRMVLFNGPIESRLLKFELY